LQFKLALRNRPETETIQAVLLHTQIQIESPRRAYNPREKAGLVELFGAPEEWGRTLRNWLWAISHTTVGTFAGRTEARLPVPCTYDSNARFHVPIVITGFEPVDLLQGVLMTLRQLEAGRHEVENQYPRVVKREGNRVAQDLLKQVFEVCDRKWRGVGTIPQSTYYAYGRHLEFLNQE
jgi:hypothetical protein